ncbi:hypothetical protein B0H14DRAFT_2618470 [Mycena olivaceomarginata]|nr:hypothetical protein B0H14DRAFT_2618470 [Mycena olivaceomarginata]
MCRIHINSLSFSVLKKELFGSSTERLNRSASNPYPRTLIMPPWAVLVTESAYVLNACSYSGEDVDSVGYVVESDGEEEGHEEGMLEVERMSVSEFKCCVEFEAISIPSNYFYEYLDVPAAEYLNSLHIQGWLFSEIEPGSTATMVAVIEEWRRHMIAMSEKRPICLVMKSSQDFFNSTGAKATDQLQRAPIFPVTNCVRAIPSGLDLTRFSSSRKPPDQPSRSRNPHYLIFPATIPFNSMQTATHAFLWSFFSRLKSSVCSIRRLPLSQMGQRSFSPIVLQFFGHNGGPMAVTTVSRAAQRVRFLSNYERTITVYRNKIRTPFLAKGGEDWPKVPRLTDISILVPGSKVVNKTTLGLRKRLLEATPIAESGALPKRQRVNMLKGDEENLDINEGWKTRSMMPKFLNKIIYLVVVAQLVVACPKNMCTRVSSPSITNNASGGKIAPQISGYGFLETSPTLRLQVNSLIWMQALKDYTITECVILTSSINVWIEPVFGWFTGLLSGYYRVKSAPGEKHWTGKLRKLSSVDGTEQQEAMQALAENFEMTESFTIRKPEDETSMQLF